MNEDAALARWAQTLSIIESYGHQIISVFPNEDDPPTTVPFSYTVGRILKGRPELVITGPIAPNVAGAILNDTCAADDDEPLEPGQDRERLLVGYPLHVVEADPVAAEMFQAIRFAELSGTDDSVRALQLVWPDPQKRFPWDEGYEYPPFVQPVHRAQ